MLLRLDDGIDMFGNTPRTLYAARPQFDHAQFGDVPSNSHGGKGRNTYFIAERDSERRVHHLIHTVSRFVATLGKGLRQNVEQDRDYGLWGNRM